MIRPNLIPYTIRELYSFLNWTIMYVLWIQGNVFDEGYFIEYKHKSNLSPFLLKRNSIFLKTQKIKKNHKIISKSLILYKKIPMVFIKFSMLNE